jgi:GT2 family glycosyltransferase
MSLFSVIVPSFNRVALLGASLESILAQRFTDFDIIVVDDGSTDGTMDYLESFRQRIKVFRQANQGPGAARNLGARHSRGTYLAFLDSDDLWFPWTLEVYRDVIHMHTNPSFIAGKPYSFSVQHELNKIIHSPVRTEQFADYLGSGDKWRWWGVSSFVIRRDIFIAARGFAEEWINGEDADLALRLGVAPRFVQITAPVTFAYRDHAVSAAKDLRRTFAGAWSNVCAERAGRYPGGVMRARERRRILVRHTRPVTLTCLQQGLRREAWKLFGATFAWNASLGRVKYLAAFPLLAAISKLRAVGAPSIKLSTDSQVNRTFND